MGTGPSWSQLLARLPSRHLMLLVVEDGRYRVDWPASCRVRFWPGTASRPWAAGYATSAPVRAVARQLFVRFFRLHLFALRVRHLRERVGTATARRLDCHELQRREAATPASKSEGNIGTGTTLVHDAVCAAKALVR